MNNREMFGYYKIKHQKIKTDVFGDLTENISTYCGKLRHIKSPKNHLHFSKNCTKLKSANNKQKR